jgi:hypothetical protein
VSPGDGPLGIVQEMESETAGHNVEGRIWEAKPVGVHDARGELEDVAVVPG